MSVFLSFMIIYVSITLYILLVALFCCFFSSPENVDFIIFISF